MELKCKKCGRQWDYKGAKVPTKEYTLYTSCPVCKNLVKLEEYSAFKARIEISCGNCTINKEEEKVLEEEITKLIEDKGMKITNLTIWA